MVADKELVREIQNGNEPAMNVLVRRYYNDIFSYVLRRTTNKQNAYDLTQEVFIKMLKNMHTFNNSGKFKSWLFTIAVNQCRDFFKSKAFQSFKNVTEMETSTIASDDNTSFIFEKKEMNVQLKKAIAELPDYQSECILLKYFHDLKIKEIAGIMNTSESTVKSRLRQGTIKLRKILEKGGMMDEREPGFRKRV